MTRQDYSNFSLNTKVASNQDELLKHLMENGCEIVTIDPAKCGSINPLELVDETSQEEVASNAKEFLELVKQLGYDTK